MIGMWEYASLDIRKRFININLANLSVEVTKPSTGGPGSEPTIEIRDYQWR
ncbi:hypothetical protein D3C84_1156190 [compost metagenome]